MRRTSDDIMEKFDYYGVILNVYQKYGIRAFPIDVFSLESAWDTMSGGTQM